MKTDPKTVERDHEALERALVDADARAAIAERRAHAHYLLPLLKAAGAVRDDAGRKVVRYQTIYGWLDANDYLDELRRDGDFALAFPADAAPSKTSKPAKPTYAKPNPFAKKTFSLTEQMKVTRENPALAEALKAAADA